MIAGFGTDGADLLVDPTAAGTYRTVSAAYSVANDGDTILISPGTYTETPPRTTNVVVLNRGKRVSLVPNNGQVRIQVGPAPTNDNFASEVELPGDAPSITGSNWLASSEPNESQHPCLSSSRSVWYAWTAPKDGSMEVKIISHVFLPWVTAFTGGDHASLSEVAGSFGRDPTGRNLWRLRFVAQQGVRYHLRVSSLDDRSGDFSLGLSYAEALVSPNDDFVNRIGIDGTNAIAVATFAGATLEIGEPESSGANGPSLWWSWRAPEDGLAMVRSSVRDGFNHALAAYTGDAVCSLVFQAETLIGLSNDPLVMEVRKDTQYQLSARSTDSFASGDLRFELQFLERPPNDSLANPAPLEGAWFVTTNSNLAATREMEEFIPDPIAAGKTLWWSWTAPATPLEGRPVVISTAGSSFDTLLSVYSGPPSAETRITMNDDEQAYSQASRVTFVPDPGRTYLIAVDGAIHRPRFESYAGEVRLTLDYSALNLMDQEHHLSCDQPDDCLKISGSLQVRHFGEGLSQPLRVRLFAVERFRGVAGVAEPVPSPRSLLTLSLPGNGRLAAGASTTLNYADIAFPPPDREFDATVGYIRGWVIIGMLEEQLGADWFLVDDTPILYAPWPLLAGFTPNGPFLFSDPSSPQPPDMISLSLLLPEVVGEGSIIDPAGLCNFKGKRTQAARPDFLITEPFRTNALGALLVPDVSHPIRSELKATLTFRGLGYTSPPVTIMITNVPSAEQRFAIVGSPARSLRWALQGLPKTRVVMESVNNLAIPPHWTSVRTNVLDPFGIGTIELPLTPGEPERYFRLRQLP